MRGDFGVSLLDGEYVRVKLAAAISKTLIMSVIALFVYTLNGVIIGMSAAMSRSKVLQKIVTYWTVLSMAIPPFWIVLFAVWFLSVKLKLLHISGFRSIRSLIVPGILMGILDLF